MQQLTENRREPTEQLTEGRMERARGTRTAAGTVTRFLVVGTAIAETVVHAPRGGKRQGLGGVAATIAAALAQEGNEVTLVTCIGRGEAGRMARRLLEEIPIRTVIRSSSGQAGYATISTRGGEPAEVRGKWPRAVGLAPLAERELGNHQVVITDTNIEPGEIRRILDHPGIITMVNGTTTRGVVRIPMGMRNPLGMITINRHEARALMQQAGTPREEPLPAMLGTESLLITLDREGWVFHRRDAETITSPAEPVPESTDFVGCGDYAAAGAIHAVAHRLDPRETINTFIQRKLEANVVTPTRNAGK